LESPNAPDQFVVRAVPLSSKQNRHFQQAVNPGMDWALRRPRLLEKLAEVLEDLEAPFAREAADKPRESSDLQNEGKCKATVAVEDRPRSANGGWINAFKR
jgi:hypothetical protein